MPFFRLGGGGGSPSSPSPRDPIGITSLYIGWGRDGAVWLASEMKCLKDECVR